MDPSAAKGYKSASQIARRVTEEWATHNLYCAACSFNELSPAKANAPVLDFRCPECSATYQLKSKRGRFGRSVSNSAYNKKIEAIYNGSAPNYAFLEYSAADWTVTGLFLVPGHFFTPALIQERARLSSKAQRAGWVGSNILLGSLPDEARVTLVSDGKARHTDAVREDWARFQFLQAHEPELGGWGAAVLACVRTTIQETGSLHFTLQEFTYRYAPVLASQYPNNQHVEAKIRQQLQVLRDVGILNFVDNQGTYAVIR